MGTRGPVPQRKDQLLGHRTKEELDNVTRVKARGTVRAPRPDKAWHPIAKMVYNSAKKSGQSEFYEPSDWAMLYSLCEDLSDYKYRDKRNGQILTSIYSTMSSLLMTEGDRRRVQMEIDRGPEVDPVSKAADDFYNSMNLTG